MCESVRERGSVRDWQEVVLVVEVVVVVVVVGVVVCLCCPLEKELTGSAEETRGANVKI